MISIVPYYAIDEAVQMVKDRIVNVIIVGFDSRVARQLAVATDEFGGQVVYVHPTPTTIHPPRPSSLPDMDALILRWWDAGRTAHEIAQDIGGETTDVARGAPKGR
jgi:hypothetical protein